MDDKRQVGSPDRDLINLKEEYEVSYWSKELKVEPDDLRKAVAAAGASVNDVRKYLKK